MTEKFNIDEILEEAEKIGSEPKGNSKSLEIFDETDDFTSFFAPRSDADLVANKAETPTGETDFNDNAVTDIYENEFSEDDSEFTLAETSSENERTDVTIDEKAIESAEKEIKRIRQKLSPEEIIKKRQKAKRKKVVMGAWHTFSIIRVVVIIVVSVFLSVKAIGYGSEFLGINRSAKLVQVKIPDGAGTAQIARILADTGVIDTPFMFEILTRLKKAGGSFVKGEHYVSANMGYNEIIDELTKSRPRETVTITFPEGENLLNAANKLLEAGVIGKITPTTTDEMEAEYLRNFLDIFNSFTNDYEFEKHLAPTNSANRRFYAREGFFCPDTYEFYKYVGEEDIQVVCAKIYDNFEKKISPHYSRMTAKGMTLDDTIILASIIQAEAPSKSEMERVSSVFHNRLDNPAGIGRNQPYLESDPTVKYYNTVIRPNMDPGTERDRLMNEYDTYKTSGLPIGAICNPGADALRAALYPSNTPYYYFAANINTRVTYYAITLEEHETNLELIKQQYLDADSTDN